MGIVTCCFCLADITIGSKATLKYRPHPLRLSPGPPSAPPPPARLPIFRSLRRQCPTLHGQQVLPFFAERKLPVELHAHLNGIRCMPLPLFVGGDIRQSHFTTHLGGPLYGILPFVSPLLKSFWFAFQNWKLKGTNFGSDHSWAC